MRLHAFVAVWSSVMLAAPAQQKALRHDAAAWVPTEEGSNWTYHRVTTNGAVPAAKGEARISKGLFGTYRRADGSRWHLVAMNDGGSRCYEHWNTEGPGLLVQATATALVVDGVPTACPLAAPVGAVTSWAWEQQNKQHATEHRASLVAFDEAVTVPAGTFRAAHVRIVEHDLVTAETATSEWWFARDVGVVRQLHTDGDDREVTELLSFTRGRDQTQERLATLQMLAPPAWLWTKRGAATIRWLDQDPGSVAFGGRFAIVGDGAELQVAFVRPGTCLPLPADGVQVWREIMSEQARHDLVLVAMTAARVHAGRLQLGVAVIENDAKGKVTLRATQPDGERSFEVLARYTRGSSTRVQGKEATASVEVEITPQTEKR